MSTMIQAADQFTQAHARQVNPRYLPQLHAHPPIGWVNDPNGLCYFHGEYHLYVQHYPYSASWNNMHWGHWTSDDLIAWTWRGVAMAPDMPYDSYGCFSGHAVAVENRLYVMYTGVSRAASGEEIQQQCVAVSDDGYHFTKYEGNPVIPTSMLPEGCEPRNFRDPKVYRDKDGYHALLAARDGDGGRLLLYRSDDMLHWQYERTLIRGVGHMLECPDAFALDGSGVAVACVIDMEPDGLRYPNRRPALYALAGDGRNPWAWEALDFGFDFYAPQTLATPDGRRVMIGWMNGWKSDFPPRYLGDGWNGAMTIPRELSLHSGRLCQTPVRELEAYRSEEWAFAAQRICGTHPRQCDMLWQIDPGTAREIRLDLLQSEDERFSVVYSPQERVLSVDRSRAGWPMGQDGAPEENPVQRARLPEADGPLTLRILRDNAVVEIFAGEGEVALTSWAFPKGAANRFTASSDDGSARFALRMWTLRTPL